jgi:hypothetical protein
MAMLAFWVFKTVLDNSILRLYKTVVYNSILSGALDSVIIHE